MNTCNILTSSCDDDFVLRAFQDFTDRRVTQLEKLNAVVVQAYDLLGDEDSDNDITMPSDADIENLLTENGFNEDLFILSANGYVSVKDLIKGLLSDEVQIENMTSVTPSVLTTFNTLGAEFSQRTAKEVLNDIIDSISNAKVMSVSTGCMAEKIRNGLSSAYTIMNERVGRVCSVTSKVVSAAKNFYGNVLDAATTARQFLSTIYENIGVEQFVDDNTMPLNSLVYKCTGASPACSLDFKNVGYVLGAPFYAGYKLLSAFVPTIVDKFEKWATNILFTKPWSASNPIDFEKIEYADASNLVPAIDNLSYITSHDSYDLTNVIAVYSTRSEANAVKNGLQEEFGGSEIYMRTIFGEIVFNNLQFSVNSGLAYSVYWSGDFMFKPFCVRKEFLNEWVRAILKHCPEIELMPSPQRDSIQILGGTQNQGDWMFKDGHVGNASIYVWQNGYYTFDPTYAEDASANIQAVKMSTEMYDDLTIYDSTSHVMSQSECRVASGFVNGFYGMRMLMIFAKAEMDGTSVKIPKFELDGTTWPDPAKTLLFDIRLVLGYDDYRFYNKAINNIDPNTDPASLTNRDFIEVGSGYRKVGSSSYFDTCPISPLNDWILLDTDFVFLNSVLRPCSEFLRVLKTVKDMQTSGTFDEVPFVPYRSGKETFGDPFVRIKTDQENMDAYSAFWSKVVVVAVAVTLAITVAAVSHAIIKKIAMRKQQKYYQLQQKLYDSGKSGDPKASALTGREYRKMMRFERRASAVAEASSGSSSGLLDQIMNSTGLNEPSTIYTGANDSSILYECITGEAFPSA